jgi:hypothetical protein
MPSVAYRRDLYLAGWSSRSSLVSKAIRTERLGVRLLLTSGTRPSLVAGDFAAP